MQAARGASLNLSDQADHEPARRRLDARLVLAAIAVVAYAVDLGSKQWALASLADGDVPVLGDWLTLHLTFNPGAAFSTGTDFTIVFTAWPRSRSSWSCGSAAASAAPDGPSRWVCSWAASAATSPTASYASRSPSTDTSSTS